MALLRPGNSRFSEIQIHSSGYPMFMSFQAYDPKRLSLNKIVGVIPNPRLCFVCVRMWCIPLDIYPRMYIVVCVVCGI